MHVVSDRPAPHRRRARPPPVSTPATWSFSTSRARTWSWARTKRVKAFDIDWTVPGDYLRQVFFVHVELRRHGGLLAENLYWVGTSRYARKEKCLNLNGPWDWQVGP